MRVCMRALSSPICTCSSLTSIPLTYPTIQSKIFYVPWLFLRAMAVYFLNLFMFLKYVSYCKNSMGIWAWCYQSKIFFFLNPHHTENNAKYTENPDVHRQGRESSGEQWWGRWTVGLGSHFTSHLYTQQPLYCTHWGSISLIIDPVFVTTLYGLYALMVGQFYWKIWLPWCFWLCSLKRSHWKKKNRSRFYWVCSVSLRVWIMLFAAMVSSGH